MGVQIPPSALSVLGELGASWERRLGNQRQRSFWGSLGNTLAKLGGPNMARSTRVTKAMNKTQILSEIAEQTDLSKKQVSAVLTALGGVIGRHVKKGAVGQCTIPGLMKIKTVKKPAQRAKKNVPNPFKPGELMDVKAKPASTRVKILALKGLKDMV